MSLQDIIIGDYRKWGYMCKVIVDRKTLNECLNIECGYYSSSRGFLNRIRSVFPITESDILLKHTILLRKTEYYTNNNCLLFATFYKWRLRKLQNRLSMHIPINCADMGLHIMHTGPILINEKVSIGKNCSIHTNVSIVAGGTNNGVPVLRDGVVVGVGAVILGPVVIANNVGVGANAVVNKSVEKENVTVGGIPAKIISENGRLNWNKQ